jgi:calcium binding protein 39
MSFFFRAASRQRPLPQEIARSLKDSLVALDTKTGAKVYARLSSMSLPHSHPLRGPPDPRVQGPR